MVISYTSTKHPLDWYGVHRPKNKHHLEHVTFFVDQPKLDGKKRKSFSQAELKQANAANTSPGTRTV